MNQMQLSLHLLLWNRSELHNINDFSHKFLISIRFCSLKDRSLQKNTQLLEILTSMELVHKNISSIIRYLCKFSQDCHSLSRNDSSFKQYLFVLFYLILFPLF